MLSTFSLDSIPAAERGDALRASFAAYSMPIATRFAQVGDIAARFTAARVGRVRLERFDVRGVRGTATRTVTDADSAIEPSITLHALDRGGIAVGHAERVARLLPGTAVLSSTRSPLSMTQRADAAMSTVTIPLDELRIPRSVVAAGLNRPFSGADPVAATAMRLLSRLTRDIADLPEQPWDALEATLVALVRAIALLGSSSARDARQPLAESLGDRVLHWIDEHALDAGVDPSTAAAAHGISTRYVHVILRARGVSFGARVREVRLRHAARLLRDPRCSGVPIAEIAYRAGFADHAHFSRTFRRRFDVSPSEWRATSPE